MTQPCQQEERIKRLESRMLSDHDVDVISDMILEKFKSGFYVDVGKGVMGFVWKGILLAMLVLAGYGATR